MSTYFVGVTVNGAYVIHLRIKIITINDRSLQFWNRSETKQRMYHLLHTRFAVNKNWVRVNENGNKVGTSI